MFHNQCRDYMSYYNNISVNIISWVETKIVCLIQGSIGFLVFSADRKMYISLFVDAESRVVIQISKTLVQAANFPINNEFIHIQRKH